MIDAERGIFRTARASPRPAGVVDPQIDLHRVSAGELDVFGVKAHASRRGSAIVVVHRKTNAARGAVGGVWRRGDVAAGVSAVVIGPGDGVIRGAIGRTIENVPIRTGEG